MFHKIKNRLRLFNSPAPQSWGVGFLFVTISCIIVLWMFYNRFLLTIMKKLNILFIPEKLRWKISIRWFIALIHLSVVPCTAMTAESLNLSLSDVTAVSALPAETSILWSVLPVCPLNWSMSHIAIAFSPSTKIFELFFSKIVLYSIVCFTLQTALSPVCFTKWINPKTSRPVLLWFYIHLSEIWNGIQNRCPELL